MLTPLAADLWRLAGADLRLPLGARMPIATTVIRLADRSLALYSPVAFDDAAAAAIDGLGEVGHLIAPSKLHHLYVGAAAARWPRAIVHGAPGLADKRPDLRVDRVLGASVDPAWRDTLAVELVAGAPAANEAVLFHHPSGTLICADLVFHLTRPANRRTGLVFAMMGVGGGRLAQSRAWRLMRRDRAAARASVERILAWPIARVVPCHGEPLAVDAATLATRMTRICGGRIALPLAAGAPAIAR